MAINIQFFAAAGELTGSCHLLTIGQQKILLDFGLIQGGRKDEARNLEPLFRCSRGNAHVIVQ